MRPIDADALLPNGVFYVDVGNPMKGLDELLDRIINAPTLDYAPVKRGEWIPWIEEVEIYNTGGFREPKQVGWLCSECKKGRCEFQRKHCPDCGARMDGGANHA
jgi:hypothetical protein